MKNDPVPAHSKRFSRYARDASRGTVSNSEIVAIMIHVSGCRRRDEMAAARIRLTAAFCLLSLFVASVVFSKPAACEDIALPRSHEGVKA